MLCAACGKRTERDPCSVCGQAPLLDGRYLLQSYLGRGARGATFRAMQARTGRRVAIKVLPLPRTVADATVTRLGEEAAVLRKLRHRGIPRYLDAFEARVAGRRTFCVVQELVEGRSLDEEKGSLGEDQVLAVLEEVVPILAYIHGLSPPVVHRDVTLANLYRLEEDGRLMLVGFGSFHASGSAPTTQGYVAPERLEGQIGPAADLYGLGAVALALLTGAPPDSLIDGRGRLSWPEPRPVGEMMAMLLERLLEPDPSRRLTSTDQILALVRAVRAAGPDGEAVRAALESSALENAGVMPSTYTPVPARGVTRQPPESDPRNWRRNILALRVVATVLALLLLLLFAVTAVQLVMDLVRGPPGVEAGS